MGDRARLDPASLGSEPGAVSNRYREHARELRAPDAFHRRAGGGFLADQAIGLTRHCEPTGRANARPMTGSAKQSTGTRMDGFVAALLAMTEGARYALAQGAA